jgi:hypothetical protein
MRIAVTWKATFREARIIRLLRLPVKKLSSGVSPQRDNTTNNSSNVG